MSAIVVLFLFRFSFLCGKCVAIVAYEFTCHRSIVLLSYRLERTASPVCSRGTEVVDFFIILLNQSTS